MYNPYRKLLQNEINEIIEEEKRDISLNTLNLTEKECKAYLYIVKEEVSTWTYNKYCIYFGLIHHLN